MARGDTGKTLGMAPSRFNEEVGGGRPAGAYNYNYDAVSHYGWTKARAGQQSPG